MMFLRSWYLTSLRMMIGCGCAFWLRIFSNHGEQALKMAWWALIELPPPLSWTHKVTLHNISLVKNLWKRKQGPKDPVRISWLKWKRQTVKCCWSNDNQTNSTKNNCLIWCVSLFSLLYLYNVVYGISNNEETWWYYIIEKKKKVFKSCTNKVFGVFIECRLSVDR